jgi:hypothetical protein
VVDIARTGDDNGVLVLGLVGGDIAVTNIGADLLNRTIAWIAKSAAPAGNERHPVAGREAEGRQTSAANDFATSRYLDTIARPFTAAGKSPWPLD